MAILFDAVGEKIDILDNAKFNWNPSSADRTLVFWYKSTSLPTSDGQAQLLFRLAIGTGYNVQCFIYNGSGTNSLIFGLYDSSWSEIGSISATMPATTSGVWYQYVFTLSTTGKVRRDGVDLTTSVSSWGDNVSITPDSIYFGAQSWDTMDGNMTLAHLGWFTGALSQAQTENLRANPAYYDSDAICLLSLHLAEGTGTNCDDAQTVNTETDGTLTNGTWAANPTLGNSYTGTGSFRASGGYQRIYRGMRKYTGALMEAIKQSIIDWRKLIWDYGKNYLTKETSNVQHILSIEKYPVP
jgi:hypothetical protein